MHKHTRIFRLWFMSRRYMQIDRIGRYYYATHIVECFEASPETDLNVLTLMSAPLKMAIVP